MRTLEGICGLNVPNELQWELLIVDNNSTDLTRQVCEDFRSRVPLRYLYEPRQGKSYALNRALGEATGELIVFTDDDVDAEPDWLTSYWDAALRNPDVSVFGGKILPRWEKPPPCWVTDNQHGLLINAHVDYGESEFVVEGSNAKVFPGGNMAFRRSVFLSGARFSEGLGPVGRNIHTPSEETSFEHDLYTKGHKGLYVPGAVVCGTIFNVYFYKNNCR